MWGAILSAAIPSVVGYLGQKETNEQNVALSRTQMRFQERMRGSAYQAAVSDMQKAGLNPMLAYSQGGASAPVGSMPQVQNAVGAGVSAAASAAGLLQALTAVGKTEAETDFVKAQTARTLAETQAPGQYSALSEAELRERRVRALLGEEDVPRVRAIANREGVKTEVETGRGGWEHTGFAADVRRRKAEALLSELEVPAGRAQAEFYKGIGEYSPYVKSILGLIDQLLGGAASAKRIIRR